MIRRVTRPLIVLAIATFATSSVHADPATSPNADVSMATAVRTKLPAVAFRQVAITDVFDFLRDVGQLNLYINWPALEAAGIDRATPISVNLHQIQLSKVLDLTLNQLGSGKAAITWYVSDNIVYITTRELADRELITRVYPVQDLLVDVPNFKGPTFQIGGGGGSGSDSGGSVFNNSTEDPGGEQGTMAERGEKLVELIKMLVSPDVWVDNGGYSQIRYFNGSLIVTAPRSVQAQIGK